MRPSGNFDKTYGQTLAILHTRLQWVLWIVFLALVILLPFFVGSYLTSVAIMMAIAVISVLGLNLEVGFTGLLNLGQAAFMAVGAYVCAFLASNMGWNFFPALLAGGLGAATAGVIFGAPSLRVKGFYLALATLAAHFIIIWFLMEWGGGKTGYESPRPYIFGLTFSSDHSYYYLVSGIAIFLGIVAKNLTRSKIGRAFIAIRDHDIAAEILGINVFGYKLLAFAVGSFYAGIAGGLLSHFFTYTNIESYTITDSIWYLGMILVGGMGSIIGSVFGAVFITGLDEFALFVSPALQAALPGALSAAQQMQGALGGFLFSITIILFIIFEPRGLAHRWELLKASYRLMPFSY